MKEWATWRGLGRRARALEPLGFARGITDHHAMVGSRSPLAGKGEGEPLRGADQARAMGPSAAHSSGPCAFQPPGSPWFPEGTHWRLDRVWPAYILLESRAVQWRHSEEPREVCFDKTVRDDASVRRSSSAAWCACAFWFFVLSFFYYYSTQ